MKTLALSAVAIVVTALPATAQQFVGGEATLSYSTFTGDTEGDAFNLSGSVEFAFTREIGIQADLSYTNFGEIGTLGDSGADANSIALHLIYNVSNASTVGLFYGYESDSFDTGTTVTEDDTAYVGVEVGYEVGEIAFEMYYAKPLDEIIDNASFYGISGAYALNDAFAITADADRLTTDDLADLTSVAVGVEYSVLPNIMLNAEVGSASMDTGTSENDGTFIGLGATFTFGADRGATFDDRGLSSIVPGF